MSAVHYAWRDGARWPIAADVAVQALRVIRGRAGKVTARLVVQEARKNSSPLHACFLWKNGEAAERYREMEARWLMGGIVVVMEEAPALPAVRAFVAIDVGN